MNTPCQSTFFLINQHSSQIVRQIVLLESLLLIGMIQQALALDMLPAESHMLQLLESHNDQQRTEFIPNDVLLFAARKKAEDMAAREYFSHQDPDGFGMNYTLAMAGFRHSYSKTRSSNNMESIGVRHQNGLSGESAADIVFNAWLGSPGHRTHVLGSQSFFANQTYVAVGYAFDPQGPHGWSSHYFSFLSAPPDEQAELTPVTEWLFSSLTLPQMEHGDPDEDGVSNLLEFVLGTDPLTQSQAPNLEIHRLPASNSIELVYPLNVALHPSLKWVIYSTTWIDFPFWNRETLVEPGDKITFQIDPVPARFFQIDMIRESDPMKSPF
jgi:hypothetical protein